MVKKRKRRKKGVSRMSYREIERAPKTNTVKAYLGVGAV